MPEFKMFDKVLVRDSEDDIWVATFFSHYRKDGKVIAINEVPWEYCIPALGNERLVGTNSNIWEPETGCLVAVRNSNHVGWFLRIYFGTEIRNDKKFYLTTSYTLDVECESWEYCEPAKNHFKV